MITLPNFDADFKNKKFKDTGLGTEYVCVGYGDNDSNGNPYFVGVKEGTVPGKTVIPRTVLFKNVEFVS